MKIIKLLQFLDLMLNNKVYKVTSKGDGHVSYDSYIYIRLLLSHITISNIKENSFDIFI